MNTVHKAFLMFLFYLFYMHHNISDIASLHKHVSIQLPSLFCWVRRQSYNHTKDLPWKRTLYQRIQYPMNSEAYQLFKVSPASFCAHMQKRRGEAIPKKSKLPLGFSGCSSTGLHPPMLLCLCQLPLEKLCPPCQWSKILTPCEVVLGEDLCSSFRALKKPQYRLKPRHWDSLDTLSTLASRYYRSHYHFWGCCFPMAAKDAEMPLI